MPTPDSVPPVPTEQVKPSTLPSVWSQISGPVVSIWARRLARLSNWLAQIAPFGSRRGDLLGEAAGIAHVIVRIAVGRGRDEPEIDAAQEQHVLLFLALRLGHDDDRAVAAGVADQRQADAGVAGGALDDDAAGLQEALLLGVLDDVERGAVLHRAAGVEEFGLAEDRAAGLLGGAAQLDQGRIADRADKTVADVHRLTLRPGAAVECSGRDYPRAAEAAIPC